MIQTYKFKNKDSLNTYCKYDLKLDENVKQLLFLEKNIKYKNKI